MAEIMVRFDDLRRYCEKRHCGSVPLEYIKQMPTIEAEPVRRGRWVLVIINIGGGDKIRMYQCSECNGNANMKFDFCPNCGAAMTTYHIADDSKKVGGAENA